MVAISTGAPFSRAITPCTLCAIATSSPRTRAPRHYPATAPLFNPLITRMKRVNRDRDSTSRWRRRQDLPPPRSPLTPAPTPEATLLPVAPTLEVGLLTGVAGSGTTLLT